MSDLIERQKAIEMLRYRFRRTPTYAIIAMDIIKELPSAESTIGQVSTDPQPTKTQQVTGKLDSDCVSRQAAIETLAEYGNGRTVYIGAEEAIRRIEQLPPAQPELIEKAAYIRGFEQGRTQGMIDSQVGKK